MMVTLVLNFPLDYNSVTRQEEEHMELQTRTRMTEKGRVVIPAEIRKALGMEAGGTLDMRVEDGELRISTLRARIRRVQERARKIIPPGVSLSEELSAERREAAKHE